MSRKSRRTANASADGNKSANEIVSLFNGEPEAAASKQSGGRQNRFYPFGNLKTNWKSRLLYPISGMILLSLLCMGVMAANNWLPHTDALSGKRTGWFGRDLQSNNLNSSSSASLLPFEPTGTPTPTPQLSKEYIYAGSRMLTVEDAGANVAPPADLAVWRPGDGVWYIINSSNQQWSGIQFGSMDDQPVRGDFDGDGKTDLCVFRPSNGTWYVMPSSSGVYYGVQFGLSTDKPVPADYDGDGKTDIAVFRPSETVWIILRSSDTTLQYIPFGVATDKPVPADYDGDGKADVAQYRKSAADWYWLQSGNNNAFASQHFGVANVDNAVIGDYDGDGKYDLAAWRETDSTWYINNSSNNSVTAIQWGNYSIDEAVQGDFDGDGKTDIAVWRKTNPSVGLWQIRNSSTGQTRTASWGTTNDIPVPAPYRR